MEIARLRNKQELAGLESGLSRVRVSVRVKGLRFTV